MDSILCFKKCDEDDFYKLLGCDETSTTEQILAEYKNISLQCHPDKNPNDSCAVAKFQNILKAKEYLTDPVKREIYDKWRRSGISMPFEQFLNISKSAHTSMHWAYKKQKDLMLESSDKDSESDFNKCDQNRCQDTGCWERDPCNEALRKFRNYEI
ncbi:J domain-containing protein [Parasteatoda tepidariorum]|uniref:J domain-containing protein n=1 Tax=Parasteatoda tepidariorum TaxID=114398 RepID=UPI00077FD875|nr:J domain-containing protein [Parasteatoda tepidariorum]